MVTKLPPRKRLAGFAIGLCAIWCACWSTHAQALNVFACEPEWAALSRILLPQAKVFSATHDAQDPHHIEARPSLIAQLRMADIAVCTGAELESGWLPMLQQKANNAKVKDVFFATDYAALIDAQPDAIGSPWAGDVHAQGNPHIHTDPRTLLDIAPALAKRLQQLAPTHSTDIAQRLVAFTTQWTAHIKLWERLASSLKGQTVAAQHTHFAYLWNWLGIKQVLDLEPKPGMSPTPAHLNQVLQYARQQRPMALVVNGFQDPRPVQWLNKQLTPPLPILNLPATVPEDANFAALTQWMDGLIQALLNAQSLTKKP